MEETEIGAVVSYFAKVSVAAIKLSGNAKLGDKIHIKGHTTDITQTIDSMQIDRKPVNEAKNGDSVGIKVNGRARPEDKVYKC